MPSVPYKATGAAPESTDWSWDADAQNAILGSDDDQNWSLYKQAHAWWDGSTGADAEKKAPYKLPHHRKDPNGDGLQAVWKGVVAAMARLEESDIPDDELRATFDHLTKHYAQWDKEPPEWDRWFAEVQERRRQTQGQSQSPAPQTRAAAAVAQHTSLPLVATTAPMIRVKNASRAAPGSVSADNGVAAAAEPEQQNQQAQSLARPGGVPTAEDMTRINAVALDELTADQVYVVPCEISSNTIDAYYTRMTPRTLANFVEDATMGVAFCDSHEHRQLPIGRSFYGQLAPVDRDGGQVLTAQILNYLLRNLQLSNGMNSDELIRGIQGGIYSDVSVGFIPTAYWCSICHLNMLETWDCNHWPGVTYEQEDPTTGTVTEVLCIADVDARLGESSLVYDGATPNAMTLKARHMIEGGRADPRMLAFVEDRCRVKLFDRWSGFGPGYGLAQTSVTGRADLLAPAAPATAEAQLRLLAAPAAPAGLPGEALPPTPTSTTSTSGTSTLTVRASGDLVLPPDMQEAIDRAALLRAIELLLERSSAELSQANLDHLTAIHEGLLSGHTAYSTALEALSTFVAEKGRSSDPDDPDDPDDSGEDAVVGEDDPALDDDLDPAPAAGEGEDEIEDAGAPEDTPAGEPEAEPEEEPVAEDDSDAGGESSEGDPGDPGDEQRASGGALVTRALLVATGLAQPDRAALVAALPPEMQRLLEIGRQARQNAIEETLRAGVRAVGASFQTETVRTLLEQDGVALEQIEALRSMFEAVARQVLSPIGEFVPDENALGGGRWTSEPTGRGGRQTQARDPQDPAGLVASGVSLTRGITSIQRPGRQARPRGGAGRSATATVGNPDLYRAGGKP